MSKARQRPVERAPIRVPPYRSRIAQLHAERIYAARASSCDPDTDAHRRSHAILTLLVQLGLARRLPSAKLSGRCAKGRAGTGNPADQANSDTMVSGVLSRMSKPSGERRQRM